MDKKMLCGMHGERFVICTFLKWLQVQLILDGPSTENIEIVVPRTCCRCVLRLGEDPDHVCVREGGRQACNYCRAGRRACKPVGSPPVFNGRIP